MVATPAYFDMSQVWIKAALGLSVFEGTLVLVGHAAQRVDELSALAAGALTSALRFSDSVRGERDTGVHGSIRARRICSAGGSDLPSA